ncbi:MAG: T9SS type A sorting domain-containing protein [Bacteroidetes bacterium]|nr:T9SS type A sorting domain-containing protein [Bacteroidota bacterium]
MKPLTALSFLVFLSWPVSIQAQFPNFPDSNAYWGMYSWGVVNVTPEGYHETGITAIWGYHLKEENQDTILQGTSYNALWGGAQGQESVFAGGIRNDTTGRIYYFHPTTNSEYLLYDFNAEVGDSLVVWVGEYNFTGPSLLLMHVVSLDTLENSNGVEYKRIGIVNDAAMAGGFGPEYWIQGVGGSGGLLSTYGTDLYPGDTPYLDCMSHNDTLWPSGQPGICSTVGMEEQIVAGVNVHPNPNTGQFTLNLQEGAAAVVSMTLWNSQGKRFAIRPKGSGRTMSVTLADDIPSGLYLLRVQLADGAVLNTKVIIQP